VVATRQPVTVRLTAAQALHWEKLGTYLWPQEKPGVAEISRRLLLERLLVRNRNGTWGPDVGIAY